MAVPKPKYSDAQIKKLLTGIHNGSITQYDLPEDLYYAIADYLKKGLYEGFGSSLETVSKEQEEILTDLRDNVYLFSSAKVYQFTRACSDLLVNEDGEIKPFGKFFEEGQQVFDQYNKNWAQAEYVTTIGQSQMAQQWQSIEANKEILPMLTFSTDGQPCQECEPFEGLTAHVDDPIWDIATPLLHFRCECLLIASDDAVPWTQDRINELPLDSIPDDFKNNPGKTGEIFTKEHPYFQDVPEELAKNNFGLEIPEED